ncbi:hypothetical protein [Streptomyces sp. NPDC059850]|uniref:cupin domain-containing protein n=1 Tax=Streptomyces sp. NPDC059850 TaxID=3346970 RepID=UPI0036685008
MLVTEFSTEAVAVPERFTLFEEITAGSHIRTRLRSNEREDFRAKVRVLDLGELQVSALSHPHLEITRTAKVIRQSDPEVYMINYHLGGEGSFSQARSDTAFHVGDLMVLDSSRPFDAHVHALQDNWSQLNVQLPHKLLPLPEKTVQRLLAVPISGRHGMAGVLARWLSDLNARAGEFTPADIPSLTSVTLDLLASVIARCLEAEEALSPEARRRGGSPRARASSTRNRRSTCAAARWPGSAGPCRSRCSPRCPTSPRRFCCPAPSALRSGR